MAKKTAAKQERITGTKRELLQIVRELGQSRQTWQVWADLMDAIACALSNAADPDRERVAEREKEYAECIKHLGGDADIVARAYATIVVGLEENPDQDFLGQLYMELELGSHWHGQFFTPYSICQMMAQTTMDEELVMAQVSEHGYITVNDPACGAGATLVAAINRLNRLGIGQGRYLVCGNDIDRVEAQMCYIQLSTLGAAGWVAITNTLSDPVTGDQIMPAEKPGQEFWYTPMYYLNPIWVGRRACRVMDRVIGGMKKRTAGEICFDFSKVEMERDMADEKEKKYATAREKLEAEKKAHSDDNAKVIIDYLIKRAEEDPGMGEDILQPHKTYRNCWSYIMDQAKKMLHFRSGAVRSDTVFEWAEDYYRLDDKALAEKAKKDAKKAKKYADEAKKEEIKEAQEALKQAADNAKVAQRAEKKLVAQAAWKAGQKSVEKPGKEAKKTDSKPKKKEKNDDLEGQMDIFAFLGGA